jgi:hypothetical protein
MIFITSLSVDEAKKQLDEYYEALDKMLAESSTLPMCLMDESLDEELGTC